MTMRGLFITFEGGDGSGKSTQMRLLADRLAREGHEVVTTVEPGGTAIGSQIRRILLDSANRDLRAIPEMLLYFASRAQNVEEVILPALAAGRIVLADRFTDSTMAYQGYGRGLGREVVETLHRISCRGLNPGLTLLIDIDLETSLARARARQLDATETRMDDQAAEFHRRVREGYLDMARREPARFRVIHGGAPPERVAQAVWDAVAPLVSSFDV